LAVLGIHKNIIDFKHFIDIDSTAYINIDYYNPYM